MPAFFLKKEGVHVYCKTFFVAQILSFYQPKLINLEAKHSEVRFHLKHARVYFWFKILILAKILIWVQNKSSSVTSDFNEAWPRLKRNRTPPPPHSPYLRWNSNNNLKPYSFPFLEIIQIFFHMPLLVLRWDSKIIQRQIPCTPTWKPTFC